MRFYVCIFCSKNIYDFSNWKWEWRFYIRRTWQGGRSAYWWWPGRSLHSYFLFLKAHLCDSATLAYGSCSCYYCLVISHSFATPWTVAHQAPLSMGFSKQELTGVGCHAILQGIFPTQGSNPHLLYRQVSSWPLSHQGPTRPCSSASSSRRLLPVIKFRMLVWWAFLDNL